MVAINNEIGNEGAQTTNKSTGNSLSVGSLEKREQGLDTQIEVEISDDEFNRRYNTILAGKSCERHLTIDTLHPRKPEIFGQIGFNIPKMSVVDGMFESCLPQDIFQNVATCNPILIAIDFVVFVVAFLVMGYEHCFGFTFSNKFVRQSVAAFTQVTYNYTAYVDPRHGFDRLVSYVHMHFTQILGFVLAYYYSDWKSTLLLGASGHIAAKLCAWTPADATESQRKKALLCFSSILLAPFAEEYTRHGYSGAMVWFGECLPRALAVFLIYYVDVHFGKTTLNPGFRHVWLYYARQVSRPIFVHLLLYFLPLSFVTRVVCHSIYNALCLIVQFSDGRHDAHIMATYSTESPLGWFLDTGELYDWYEYYKKKGKYTLAGEILTSKNLDYASVFANVREMDEIVDWYNYFVRKQEIKLAKEMLRKVEFLDHGQMFGFFSNLWNNNPLVGLAPSGGNSMQGLVDAIKKMKIALPVHVKHEIGLGDDTLETLKTIAWLGATVSIVEALVRKDLPSQDGYTDVLGRLAVIGGVLGLLNLTKIQNMVTGLFSTVAQTTSVSPVNLLIDGAGMFLFGKMFSSTPHGSLSALITNFGTIGRTVSNATLFMQKLLSWVQDLILYVSSCFGVEVRMANGPYTEEIEHMKEFLERINSREDEGMTITFKEIDIIKASIKRLDEMYRLSDRNNISAITRNYLAMLQKRFSSTLLRVDRPDAKLGHRDKGPWNMNLVGPPGNGKTDVTKLIAKMFVERTLESSLRAAYEKNPEHFRPYIKSVSDKFYSGLKNNCKVVLLPDCFQGTDKEGDVESEANCFIHLHSAELMAAVQAVAELKGYIFLNPIVVISDSNWLGQGDGPKSIKEKGALIRRANKFCWFLATKAGFRKANPSVSYKLSVSDVDESGCDAFTSMLDTDKAAAFIRGGGKPWELWQFIRWDMTTVRPMNGAKWIGFNEYVEILLDDFKNYWTQGKEAVQAFYPCELELTRLAFAAADDMPVEAPVFDRARPQTRNELEFDRIVASNLSSQQVIRYNGVRDAVRDSPSVELAPCELDIVEFVRQFKNTVLIKDLLDNLEMVGPFIGRPDFKAICDKTEFEYLNLPEVCLTSDVGAIRCSFLSSCELMAKMYSDSMSRAMAQLPDSYFSLDYIKKNFPTLPVISFKNGAITCGILTALCAAYYYFQPRQSGDLKQLSVAQTTSNMTNTEMFINKYTGNQLYMVLEVIPLDLTTNTKKFKELNYVTMLRGTCGVTVSHCFVEADYYASTNLYSINLLLFSFDDHERDFDRPTHRVPLSSVRRYDTSIPDIVLLDFGYLIKKYPDLYQHIPPKSSLKDLITRNNEYQIHYMIKPDSEVGQHAINSGIACPAATEYAKGIMFKCMFTDKEVVPGFASMVYQPQCLRSTLNKDGTCGLVTFLKPEASLRKSNHKYNQPVPVAIHVAGAELGLHGYEAIWYQEAFDFAFAKKDFIPPTVDFMDIKEHYASMAALAAAHGLKSDLTPPVVARDVAHEPSPVGQTVVADVLKVAPPLKSAIIPSIFKESISKVIELPEPMHRANLSYKRKDDGSYCTVVDANRVNYGRNPGGSITAEALSIVSSFCTHNLKYKMEGSGENYRKYVTSPIVLRKAYEELILGGEGNNSVRYSVLDRTKSIGSTLQFVTDVRSRKDIFGADFFPQLGSEAEKMLWSMVEFTHNKILAGEPVLAIYKAMPKDELLPASKAAVKTRLFSVGDLALLMINMIYFRDFVGVFKATRSRTGFMVGINPYDTDEWSNLAEKLKQYDGKCAMLDISKFDMSVSTPLLEEYKKFVLSVNDMLCFNSDGDFSEDTHVRSVLLDKMQDFVMLYDLGGKSAAVHMSSSIASGHYLTSTAGSYINYLTSFASKVAMKLDSDSGSRLTINHAPPDVVLEACRYVNDTTFVAIYGDDSGFSTSDPKRFNVPGLCNQLHLLFGITATNESDGRPVMDSNGFVPVDAESQIIGRGFRYDPLLGKYLAPLRYSSLFKTIAFDKVEHTVDIRRNKLDAFLREASLHGFEFHRRIVNAVRDVSRRELCHASEFEDYSLAFKAVTSGLYVPEWEQDMQVNPQSSGKPPRAARVVSVAVYNAMLRDGTFNIKTPIEERIIRPPLVNWISLCKNCTNYDYCRIESADSMEECVSISKAQSSSSPAMEGLIGTRIENTEHVTSVVCDEVGMTCFEDGAAIKLSSLSGGVVSGVPDITETIAEFLMRPQVLSSGVWTTGSVAQSVLYDAEIQDFVTVGSAYEVTPWTEKLKGYNLMTGTFVFRFTLNASKFMQGSLIHTFLPNSSQYLAANKGNPFESLVQLFQLQHVVMTTEDTTVEFELPFIGPYGYHVLGTGSNVAPGNVDWGSITTHVLTPLRVGPNALVTNADYQIYGYWKDVRLAAPGIPQSSRKKAVGRKIVDDDKVDKPISGTLSKISVASSALSGIPLIGSFANTLSWASGIASGVASAFGYAKPMANSHFMIVNQQPMKYVATADGPDAAVPLSTTSDNKTEFITDLSTTGEDEMSIRFLVTRVHYTDTINWTTSAVTGATLMSKHISPANLQGAFTNILSDTGTYVYGGPMYYLGNFFQYWRGSMIVNIKIIKTQIHTGRLMIVFTPRPYGATVNAATISNSTYALREIVDLRTQSEITLTLPYLVATDYLPVRPRTLPNPFVNASGRLDMFVLNELRCSETVAGSIDLIVTFTAGPDFELQVPTRAQYLTNNSGAQAGDNSGHSALPFIPATYASVGQTSNSVAVDSTIGAALTPVADIGPSTRCTGEMIASVKQLIMRQSTGYLFYSTARRSLLINPHDIVSASVLTGAIAPTAVAANAGILWGDMLSYIAPMYMYYKGSMIVDVYSCNTSGAFGTLVLDPPATFPFVSSSIAPYDNASVCNNGSNVIAYGPKASTDSTLMSVGNASAPNRFDAYMQSFVVPYYNNTRCAYVANRRTTTVPTDADTFRSKCALQLTYYNNVSASNGRVSRRCGDDYQLSQFVCCPPLLTRAP